MAPKGKQGTKGQKQIITENEATLKFYTYIICGANLLYFLSTLFVFWESYTARYMFLSLLTSAVYLGSYKFMTSMARVTSDPGTGAVLDGGIDLNMENGMAENMKDMILLTAGVQSLSLASNYFWLLYLAAPARAFYMLWVNILSPWFFAEAPEEAVDDKKTRKMERKMKRR